MDRLRDENTLTTAHDSTLSLCTSIGLATKTWDENRKGMNQWLLVYMEYAAETSSYSGCSYLVEFCCW